MSSTRARALNRLLGLYCLIALISISGIFGESELFALKVLAFFVTSSHVFFGICVVCFFFLIKNLH